ncbi:putative monooxygenase [Xylariaceae sp. FL1272]|nr:putative monooxygenase [Xylariaceae sp. FL1272]
MSANGSLRGQEVEDGRPNYEGRPVDQGRPVRVVLIGAGICGIATYIRLLQHVPQATVVIYEKNPSLGGTWYENRYPGVACDIPSHVYQLSFAPNPKWSKLFAEGSEILEYIKSVASKYGVEKKIKYNTGVIGAAWDEVHAAWAITTEHTAEDGSKTVNETRAEVVISASGILNNWKWPDIEGLHDFEGKLLHSANWDKSWDYAGKRVALVGCGSSAIQILPCLQKQSSEVVNFVRGGTWISQPFGSTFTENILAKSSESGNYSYSPEELARFQHDPEYYHEFRRQMESFINKDYPCLFPGTREEIDGTETIRRVMRDKLKSRPGLYEALEPSFVPGCRRLTPGPGYLESLTKPNVQFVKTPIKRVTKNAVVTSDGKEWTVDAVACATGFDSSYRPRFPVIGRGGISLIDKWDPHASAYMSHSVPGFPNYFVIGGPNSATGGGSLLLILESVIGYIVKAVQKISRERLRTMEVKQSAAANWSTFLDRYFPNTVHVDSCTSWYKVNGKITGLWPGSSLHAMKTLEHPRWEDYEYESEVKGDGLCWIGDGWTIEDQKRGDLGYYVDHINVPPIPSAALLARQP